jgi:DNA polymerase type B, organellar and viral
MNLHPDPETLIPSPADPLPIAVRAFAPPPDWSSDKKGVRKRGGGLASPSEWTLVFDTETTVDAAQRIRIGAYQFRKGEELDEPGLFYDPAAVDAAELDALKQFAGDNKMELRTVSEFVDQVLYDRAYDLRASIVGFNLPFDISRLAIKHGSARGKAMRGGFTFKLSRHWWRPAIQVRHLNARASLMQFTHPPKRRDPRGQRKRKIASPQRRGSFIDLKTIGAALLSRSFNLASLADFLKTSTRKAESGGHGKKLNKRYIRYAVQDVQATWECYQALRDRYALHKLEETQMGKILSEASLGKAYFKQIGIQPFFKLQPGFPAHLTGKILSAYFGGRAEVHWRRDIRQVLYCDFLSMYPTVCTLMGLWRFVIAQAMEWRDSTEEIRALVNSISLEELRRPEFWPRLTTLVRVKPDADIFPVRAKYDGKSQTIGLNYLTSKSLLWFTLADVIASKLLSGKSPEILEAITFSPKEPQPGLRAISVAGNSNYRVDPEKDDFFKTLIDLRTSIKASLKNSIAKEALNSDQQALKILANSTSYGIFVEMIVRDLDDHENLICHGPSGDELPVESKKVEEPGRYFHPLLATLITGAARLMLAIAERLCFEKDLDWAFCDTDSLAISKPDNMDQSEFFGRARSICDWFSTLNPYEKKGPIFKIEDANFCLETSSENPQLEPLYSYCISAKRYALFNISQSGEIIIRKASAHGLGQYLPPYETEDAPNSIPAPSIKLDDIGVERWHYDLWHQIIRAVLDGRPDEVDLSYHGALKQPAVSRYGATTPALLKWFAGFNRDRAYADQVKPFNFLSAFHAQPKFELSDDEQWTAPKRGRPRKQLDVKPIASFNRNIRDAAKSAFDRETGKTISANELKTYAEALAQYHLRPEAKFLYGDYSDKGRTKRRHVVATRIIHIGKEANKWEEQHFLGEDEEAEIEYGVVEKPGCLDGKIRELSEKLGERVAAQKLGISRTALRRARKSGVASLSQSIRKRLSS